MQSQVLTRTRHRSVDSLRPREIAALAIADEDQVAGGFGVQLGGAGLDLLAMEVPMRRRRWAGCVPVQDGQDGDACGERAHGQCDGRGRPPAAAARLGQSGQLPVQKLPGGRAGLRHPDAAPPARDYETRSAGSESMIYWSMTDDMTRRLTGTATPTWLDPAPASAWRAGAPMRVLERLAERQAAAQAQADTLVR
jgi:hypothetical protein